MEDPDFIPAQQHHQVDFTPLKGLPDHGPDFIPASSAPATPPETQSSAAMRFIKAAASRYLGATLNAGPTMATAKGYGTPEWEQGQKDWEARHRNMSNMDALKDMWHSATNVQSPTPESAFSMVKETASELNPIDMQKFESGDTAGGMGSSLMNLLLLRQAFKGNKLPMGGKPKVVPIRQPLALQQGSAAIELPPSSLDAKAAAPTGEDLMEYMPRGSAGEPAPTVTPEPQSYYAKTPQRSNVAKNQAALAKTAPAPAEQGAIEQHSQLNSPAEASAFLEKASQKLFNKSYDKLSVTEKLKTLQEGGKMQQEARTAAASPTPRVPTSYSDMSDLLRQSLAQLGKQPPQ